MIRNYHSLTWWVTVFLILVLIMVGGNMAFTIWQVNTSQQQMCRLLEAVPTPVRSQQTAKGYLFFSRLKVLEREYGCL